MVGFFQLGMFFFHWVMGFFSGLWVFKLVMLGFRDFHNFSDLNECDCLGSLNKCFETLFLEPQKDRGGHGFSCFLFPATSGWS